MEENYSHDSVELTTTLTYLGLVHGYLGELKTKKELLIRALEIEKKYYGNESFGVNIILGYIASTCEELGDFLEQKRYLKSILEIEKNSV
ncbi:MAG: hypothetical protein KTV77_00780 [Wolbachia endosymbiont of Fragariocoptes setiger]|nr:hypothetical protein [Wolbachia endosymbiont of Fragariocoptes setiger]